MPLNDEIQAGKETLLQSAASKNQIRRLEVIFEKLFFSYRLLQAIRCARYRAIPNLVFVN